MIMNKKSIKKNIGMIATLTGIAFVGLEVIAKKRKPNSQYENQPAEKNPFEGKQVIFVEDEKDVKNADGVRGHLEIVGDIELKTNIYDKYVKRALDLVLSFGGLVILSPVFASIALAIIIDDPGPVLFVQKRLGQNKKFFKLHKFRSMKMSTPHDVPTHMLDDPDQYITRVGRFLRSHSLDELPQIWDIFIGNMSVIGPRPGLWNQDVLTAERDRYSANNVKPGLTGWAQINGRDELEISEKAKLDGDYVRKKSFLFDLRCFIKTLLKINKDESIVEGGTGVLKNNLDDTVYNEVVTTPEEEKRILIVGVNSYIGDSLKEYLEQYGKYYIIQNLDPRDIDLNEEMFCGYDVVINVAGIAHIKETNTNRLLFFDVNRDLAVRIASLSKKAEVKHFIMLSSMSVYGKEEGMIKKDTYPMPNSAYGESKLQADTIISKLHDSSFKVAILRPPMVYGKNCKGNYQILRKIALSSPVFPSYNNQRSMIYIGNLCEFIRRVIDLEQTGVFFPQNKEYVSTAKLASEIRKHNSKEILLVPFANLLLKHLRIRIIKKAFGNLYYEKVDTVSKYDFETSISLTEEY